MAEQRKALCMHCGFEVFYDPEDEATKLAAWDALLRHDLEECPQNPLRDRVTALEEEAQKLVPCARVEKPAGESTDVAVLVWLEEDLPAEGTILYRKGDRPHQEAATGIPPTLYLDEGEAGREAHAFIDKVAEGLTDDQRRLGSVQQDSFPGGGGVVSLYVGSRLFAQAVLVRNSTNRSILACHNYGAPEVKGPTMHKTEGVL